MLLGVSVFVCVYQIEVVYQNKGVSKTHFKYKFDNSSKCRLFNK